MSKFNFDMWKDKKVCMHCKTEEEANDFCRVMQESGLSWSSRERYIGENLWGVFEEETAYCFNEGIVVNVFHVHGLGYLVLEWSDYMNNENKHFTKADLRNGDVCVYRNGKSCIALVDLDALVSVTGYNLLHSFNNNLTDSCGQSDYDIVKVFRPEHAGQCQFFEEYYSKGKLVFERSKIQPVEITLEEIAKLKGVSVEQIKIVDKKVGS